MSSVGQDIDEIVQRVSIDAIKLIVGDDIAETLKLLIDLEAYPMQMRKVAADLLYGSPEKYFSEAATRTLVYEAMPKEKIVELSKRLGLPGPEALATFDPSGDPSVFSRYLGFFGIDVRAANISVVEPNVGEVKAEFGLFPHQRKAAERVWKVIGDGHGRVVLHMPTGAGKTRTAMHILSRYLNANEPGVVVWLANSSELLEQAADAFGNAWPRLGARDVSLCRMWGGYNPDLSDLQDGLIVAGLQKMHAFSSRDELGMLRLASRVKLVVVDEAHQSIAPTYRAVIERLADAGQKNALLGLTATPGRTWSDIEADQELSEFFHEKKVMLEIEGWENPVDYLISEEYLARPNFRTLAHTRSTPLKGVSTKPKNAAEDYSSDVLDQLTDDASRNTMILDEINRLIGEGHKRIIVFASSVRHAEILAAILSATGVNAGLVTGETSHVNRRRTIKAFRAETDRPMVMCNFGVLTTGFDAPKTSAAIIARPTRSLVLFSQMAGRATRGIKAGGNRECTVSTVVDTALPGFGNMAEAFANWEDVWDDG